MATGKSGYFDLTAVNDSTISVRVYWTETYDLAGNASDSLTFSMSVKSSNWYNVIYYPSGTLSINGNALVNFNSLRPSHSVSVRTQNAFYSIGGTPAAPWEAGPISHEEDGSANVTVSLDIVGYTANGKYGSGWHVQGTQSIALTSIPRAATISAVPADIGECVQATIKRSSTQYMHSVKYEFEGVSGWINANGEMVDTEERFAVTNLSIMIPETFYNLIPDSPSGICMLTCTTYNGDNVVGESQCCETTITAAQERCGPVFEDDPEVIDTNAKTVRLTGDSRVLVKGFSNALCTMKAAARNGATIVKRTIGGIELDEESMTIEGITWGESGLVLEFTATDSRGYTVRYTADNPTVEYTKPTMIVSNSRISPSSKVVNIKVNGSYFEGNFGAEDNTLTARYWVDSSEDHLVVPVASDGKYSIEAQIDGVDYDSASTLYVEIKDLLSANVSDDVILQGIPVFDWGEKDFAFHVPVSMNGNAVINLPEPIEDGDAATKLYVDNFAVDYIVAQGSSGIWTYQKWNSGKIELWTESISHTVSFSYLYTNLYLSNFTVTVPLVTKVIYANIQETAWHYAQWTTTTRNSTNQIVCRYYSANQNGNGKTYTFMAHVIGTWK